MEDRAAEWTLAVVLAVSAPEVAEMVIEPSVRAVTSPPEAIDTTRLFEEAQVTEAVISCTVPSENVPLAVNCWSVPRDKTASWGAIASESKVGRIAATVRVAVETMCPEVAEMIETPGEKPLARPATPPAFIVATATFPECQPTEEVTSR
jgi:hypothetical protein